MTKTLSILTFNWHEPYISLLAKTGHNFSIAEPDVGRGLIRRWNRAARPVPAYATIVSQKEAVKSLEAKNYDLVVCHNISDMKRVAGYGVPKILLFHNKLTTELALGKNTVTRVAYLDAVEPYISKADKLVFVSESKQADWDLQDGMVIAPGIDFDATPAYRGNITAILQVVHRIKERDIMSGATLSEKITAGFDYRLVGDNPTYPDSHPATNHDELMMFYTSHRLYLNTTWAPYEDGYNLAMLEAMACGAPVVSFANPTSFITDGVDGFISSDVNRLRGNIKKLLADDRLAKKIGAAGKETAKKMFGIKTFVDRWNRLFYDIASGKAHT